jgi:hypothetical protein
MRRAAQPPSSRAWRTPAQPGANHDAVTVGRSFGRRVYLTRLPIVQSKGPPSPAGLIAVLRSA